MRNLNQYDTLKCEEEPNFGMNRCLDTDEHDRPSNIRKGVDLQEFKKLVTDFQERTYKSKKELLVVDLRQVRSAEQEQHDDGALRNGKQIGLESGEALAQI